jgi:hypothetical protein
VVFALQQLERIGAQSRGVRWQAGAQTIVRID